MTISKSMTNKQIQKSLEEFKEDTSGKFDAIMKALEGMSARDRPTGVTKVLAEATSESVPQIPEEIVSSDDDTIIQKSGDIDLGSPYFKAKADAMKFEEEMLTVRIHDTSERNADATFEIFVNGQRCVFRRGETKRVPRKFVGVLASAKPVHYDNVPSIDRFGMDLSRQVARRGLRFPFDVLEDPNPRGKEWLQKKLAAA